MHRLAYLIASTRQFAALRDFYHDGVGLELRAVEDGTWAEFDTAGTSFALHATDEPAPAGLELRFETQDLDADLAALGARGVEFDGPPVEFARGRLVRLRDPDGNALSLWQASAPVPSGLGPAMGSVIVNARAFTRVVGFYRDHLGLAVSREDEHWVEFDTGLTRLAVHARPADQDHPRHAEQPVAWTFETDDVTAWAEAIRGRGLHFLTAPITEDFGTYAELNDPDGRIVVLREPPAEPTVEERLAEAFEDDGPRRTAIRKPIVKGTQAISRLVNKPGYRTKKKAAKRAAAEKKPASPRRRAAVAKVRGAGPVRSRAVPKTTRDTKRAKAKPATGSLKRAKARVSAQKKRATAVASRGKPVKRQATKRGAAARPRARAGGGRAARGARR
uniref:VOC domain-containing protein n=1 Tax=Eiseniibacteriota bacterium TaxID=2212470 RepID=A0A832MKP4_UNCEI